MGHRYPFVQFSFETIIAARMFTSEKKKHMLFSALALLPVADLNRVLRALIVRSPEIDGGI
jgi:hypothetical protein